MAPWLLAVGGCFAPEGPPLDSGGWASRLAAGVVDGQVVDLAAAPGAEPLVLSRRSGAETWVLSYAESLAELGLTEGAIELAGVGARCFEKPRPLPPPAAVGVLDPDAEAIVAVDPASAPFLSRPILAPFDLVGCGAAGGCLYGALDQVSCALSCPPPMIAPVAPPLPPQRPLNARGDPLFDCPVTAPTLAGSEGCYDLGNACPTGPDRFGGVRSDPTIYLDPSAVGPADGSHDRPFGTFAEAIAAAGPGQRILIATGTVMIGPSALSGDFVIEGVCTSDTILRSAVVGSPLEFNGGAVELRRLRIASPGDFGLLLGQAEALLDELIVEQGVSVDHGSTTIRHSVFQGEFWVSRGALVASDLVFGAPVLIGSSTVAALTPAKLERLLGVGANLGLQLSQVEAQDLSLYPSDEGVASVVALGSTGIISRLEVFGATAVGVHVRGWGEQCEEVSTFEIDDLRIDGRRDVGVPALVIEGVNFTGQRLSISGRQGTAVELGTCGGQTLPTQLSDLHFSNMAVGVEVEERDQIEPVVQLQRIEASEVGQLLVAGAVFGPMQDVRGTGIGRIFNLFRGVDFAIEGYDVEAAEVGLASDPQGQVRLEGGVIRGAAGRAGAQACLAGQLHFEGAAFLER